MKYEIFGGSMPAVTIFLDRGESIYTQSGGMTWMTDRMDMQTNMKGGLMKGLGRLLSGESLFMATYSAMENGQSITLASSIPGSIVALDLSNAAYIAQKSSFLGATPNVQLEAYVPNGIASGLFGGEGFILQRLSGNGIVWLELDGSLKEISLSQGEKIIVNTGNVALFEERVRYSVQTVKGFSNVLFGGEGLFLTTLEGPGKAWLQTMTASSMAQRLLPFYPAKHNNG